MQCICLYNYSALAVLWVLLLHLPITNTPLRVSVLEGLGVWGSLSGGFSENLEKQASEKQTVKAAWTFVSNFTGARVCK